MIAPFAATSMCEAMEMGAAAIMANTALGIDPEVVTFAKAIAGGVPMGACIFKGKGNVFKAGDHQSTFAGNPLACAAADVVLDTITAPGFFESVTEKGEYIKKTIASWNIPFVKEIRGRGLVIGVQVEKNPVEIEKACLTEGLLFSTAGSDVLRFVPPLNITYKEIDAGLAILKKVLQKA